ncbi:MAG TPA: hypothetical protein VMU08_04920 [Rhizomicrobium sp.]|nr:hypothetical protein [Rhizomicrobium sp.]
MSDLRQAVLQYLEQAAPVAQAFWTTERARCRPTLIAACDVLYALILLGCGDLLVSEAANRFTSLLSNSRLAGGVGRGAGRPLNIHLSAYALGTLNLLLALGRAVPEDAFRDSGWRVGELVDPQTLRPRWPAYLSHHSWRVGHWIGGVPSIIKSLWALSPGRAARNGLPALDSVLRRSDELIDSETGLLRAYRLETPQRLFRLAYRLRHDPDVGDIGGVAHLHWVNYAAGRLPYKSAPALFARTWRVLQRRPFIEGVPYCLDFDVLHLARTSLPQCASIRRQFADRVRLYVEDVSRFYSGRLDAGYSLHKLPGGLAALHECAIATGEDEVPGLQIPPVDVAKQAHWI